MAMTRTTLTGVSSELTRPRAHAHAMQRGIVFLLALSLQQCAANSVEGWTESVRINMLLEVLENMYLRSPVAIVLELRPKTVRSFKTLWYDTTEQGLPDRNVLFHPVSLQEVGTAKLYNTEKLSGVLNDIHPAADASVEEEPTAGPLLSAVLTATTLIPFDSAVLVVTGAAPEESQMVPIVAEMLIRKRARLYVIWTAEEDMDEDVLRETALLTGGAFYYVETNAVIRTRMLRIESTEIDQTIIRRSSVANRLESKFVLSEEDVGFRVKIMGNISQALLIDPQGFRRDLLEAANDSSVDVTLPTNGMLAGGWLLITQGVENETYDILVKKEDHLSLEESTTYENFDMVEAENLEEETSPRLRRASQDAEVLSESEKVVFPEETKNATKKAIVTSGQQKSVIPVSVPLIVELASGSNLEVRPGATTQLQFEVTNNANLPTSVTFTASGRGVVVQSVQPQQTYLIPYGTTKVQVDVSTLPQQTGSSGVLTFTVLGASRVISRSAYIYATTTTMSDTWDPKLEYKYKGDCRQFDEPATCNNGQWSIEATFKDEDSGLLKVMSEPFGLLFGSEFIAGTKSPVTVTYVASCCKPKVDIWAEDLFGNYKKRTLDVFHQGLLDGEIAAIVVGVILLLLIIILIVVIVLYCRKRNSDRIVLPRHRAGSK